MAWGAETIQKFFDRLKLRKRAYQLTFSCMPGQEVLIDLARFCRANETCYHDDPRLHAVLEGRREVWLRIQQHMHLSGEQLLSLYGGKHFQVVTENEDDDI